MIIIVLPDLAEEDSLLKRARRGDDDAIRLIYEQYFPPIYQFIRMRVDEIEIAEDITSEVFLKLVAALRGKNAPKHSLRGWLFRVARNILFDHYGRERRFTQTILEEWVAMPAETGPELQFIREMDNERCRKAIQELPLSQQEVVILRFSQSLSLQETADIMGRNTNTIKQLQFRAVNNLRRILGAKRTEHNDQ
jgi:RNA polymerase sigma-70 factor, ECF subfamily